RTTAPASSAHPSPKVPRPPAFETAAGRRGSAATGASTIGSSIPSNSHTGVRVRSVMSASGPSATALNVHGGLHSVCVRSLCGSDELLVPTVEGREVARIPSLAQARGCQVPVGADLARHVTEVVPEVHERRASPEPVAVVNLVDHQPGLEH